MSKVHSTIKQFVSFKERYRSANLFENNYLYFLAFKVLFDQLLHLMPEQIEISIQYIKII